jgi:uncharacterized oligopeptide transporter (OPT) family protein
MFGTVVGTAVIVPAFYSLVPGPAALGTERFPAPMAQLWRGVAEALAHGIHALHPAARWGVLVGAAIGMVLPVLEFAFPKVRRYVPSALGVGLAMVVPGTMSVTFFFGALAAWLFTRVRPRAADTYVIPVASGFMAGESVLGVAIALLAVAGLLK